LPKVTVFCAKMARSDMHKKTALLAIRWMFLLDEAASAEKKLKNSPRLD